MNVYVMFHFHVLFSRSWLVVRSLPWNRSQMDLYVIWNYVFLSIFFCVLIYNITILSSEYINSLARIHFWREYKYSAFSFFSGE